MSLHWYDRRDDANIFSLESSILLNIQMIAFHFYIRHQSSNITQNAFFGMKIEVDMSNYFVCIIIEAANYMNACYSIFLYVINQILCSYSLLTWLPSFYREGTLHSVSTFPFLVMRNSCVKSFKAIRAERTAPQSNHNNHK